MFVSSIVAFTSYLMSAASSSSYTASTSSSSQSSSYHHHHSSSPFVLAFGTSPLTQRLVLEEVLLVGAGVLFPLSMVLGLLSIRIAALYNPIPHYIRYDVWNLLIRFIMADIILEWILLPRFQCVMILPTFNNHHHEEDDMMMFSSSSSSFLSSYLYYNYEWLVQSLGYGGCQRTTSDFSWQDLQQQQLQSSSSSNDPTTTTTTATSNLFVGTPMAMGILFAIRLLWICAGVYLGEGFFPICLTGGIACGKSTVAHYLLQPPPQSTMTDDDDMMMMNTNADDHHDDDKETTPENQTSTHDPNNHNSSSNSSSKPQRRRSGNHSTNSNNNNNTSHQKKTKQKSSTATQQSFTSKEQPSHQPPPPPPTTTTNIPYESYTTAAEGSVYLVDTDSIAHDILLPPGDPDSTVDPAMSVYDQILHAFGEYDILEETNEQDYDHDDDDDNPTNKTTDDDDDHDHGLASQLQQQQQHRRKRIDRRKLGAIVFADITKRRMLNQLTHPRIRVVLVQRLLYGLYGSGKDLCVSDVPLLFESGGPLRWIFGLVVLVTCRKQQPELQLQRLIQRNPDLTLEQCQQRIASQMPLQVKEKRSHIVLDNSTSRADLAAAVERAREEMMMRVHGMGISLFQMLLILGGSVPVAVLCKMYSLQQQ